MMTHDDLWGLQRGFSQIQKYSANGCGSELGTPKNWIVNILNID